MTDKPLMTLQAANEAALKRHWGDKPCRNVPNGIACASCGDECVDIDRGRQLMTLPPQYEIACLREGCGWRASRYV